MAHYVDGFVLPVSRDRLDEYKRVAEAAAEIWKEHGALEYWECLGDDLNTECTRSFVDMTNATDDETVIFAWAIFESREARDAANEKIMADPRMAEQRRSILPGWLSPRVSRLCQKCFGLIRSPGSCEVRLRNVLFSFPMLQHGSDESPRGFQFVAARE